MEDEYEILYIAEYNDGIQRTEGEVKAACKKVGAEVIDANHFCNPNVEIPSKYQPCFYQDSEGSFWRGYDCYGYDGRGLDVGVELDGRGGVVAMRKKMPPEASAGQAKPEAKDKSECGLGNNGCNSSSSPLRKEGFAGQMSDNSPVNLTPLSANSAEPPTRPDEPRCEKCGNERDPDSCETHVVKFGHDFVYPRFTNAQLARACLQMADDNELITKQSDWADVHDDVIIDHFKNTAKLLHERK